MSAVGSTGNSARAVIGGIRPNGPPSRAELDLVWELADATLRAHGSGLLADLAWATMRSLAWTAGQDAESPATEERLRYPSLDRIAIELLACEERLDGARTRAEHAQWTGVRDALSFALGNAGPFWWSAAASLGR